MIIGAGLAGLIAAQIFPREQVLEARAEGEQEHQALLRFRSSEIADLTGIPFKKVTVHKGIWFNGGWTPPTISACNAYSAKVIGAVQDRSIWDISPCERWIPPINFQEQLTEMAKDRIEWKSRVTPFHIAEAKERDKLIISTAPLSIMAADLLEYKGKFKSESILTCSMIMDGYSVYQTVYFPSERHGLYRASLAGDRLTLEWAGASPDMQGDIDAAAGDLADAFGSEVFAIATMVAWKQGLHVQKFGKLAPIENEQRKALIFRLSREHGVYSLGRFATWRNVMLDDIVHDAAVIKQLYALSKYDRALQEGKS